MKIIEISQNTRQAEEAYQLFCQAIEDGELLHKPIDRQTFDSMLFCRTNEVTSICLSDEAGTAFAFGNQDCVIEKAFITLLLVKKGCRRLGLARQLLSVLEKKLTEGKENCLIELSFFNPCTFTWKIPGLHEVYHPNMPGVNLSSVSYLFFQNCGYRNFSLQNSYYMKLSQYELSMDLKRKKKQLETEGFFFELYDEQRHTGMKETIESFSSPIWNRDVLAEPSMKQGGRPIIIPVYQNRVCGFAGPLDVEKNGRGYFAGIGIGEAYRGKGLAKVLFGLLCNALKEKGASYMTLFTGEQNKARNIYEAAGFRAVQAWADMRKTV